MVRLKTIFAGLEAISGRVEQADEKCSAGVGFGPEDCRDPDQQERKFFLRTNFMSTNY